MCPTSHLRLSRPGHYKVARQPKVSPQVSREIAGHISQVMPDRYSIQRFDTKKAALDALEDPSARPPEPRHRWLPRAAGNGFTHATIQAEIARQVAQALQQHLAAAKSPEPVQATYKRTRKRKAETPGPAWSCSREVDAAR